MAHLQDSVNYCILLFGNIRGVSLKRTHFSMIIWYMDKRHWHVFQQCPACSLLKAAIGLTTGILILSRCWCTMGISATGLSIVNLTSAKYHFSIFFKYPLCPLNIHTSIIDVHCFCIRLFFQVTRWEDLYLHLHNQKLRFCFRRTHIARRAVDRWTSYVGSGHVTNGFKRCRLLSLFTTRFLTNNFSHGFFSPLKNLSFVWLFVLLLKIYTITLRTQTCCAWLRTKGTLVSVQKKMRSQRLTVAQLTVGSGCGSPGLHSEVPNLF